MKPHLHANASAKRWGGQPSDYQDIHDFIDSPKVCLGDMRHRAILHHTLGCFIAERVFGITRINSDGKTYSVRDVVEQHVIEDLGCLPTPQDYLECMTLEPWMGNPKDKQVTRMSLDEAFGK
jgi:hypothetical protein